MLGVIHTGLAASLAGSPAGTDDGFPDSVLGGTDDPGDRPD
jgi:hypothetical protein